MTDHELRVKSVYHRKKLLKYIKKANAGHTGGSSSGVDILSVLYDRIFNISPEKFDDPERDRYIHSKGHSVEALYVVLADKGFFPESDLETLCQYRSHYVGHPTRKVKGIEQKTGALGHGLAFSVGVALAAKKENVRYNTYTLPGDKGVSFKARSELGKANLDVFSETLVSLAERDNHVLAVTTDSRGSGRSLPFADRLLDPIVEAGVAEQNLVGIAAVADWLAKW